MIIKSIFMHLNMYQHYSLGSLLLIVVFILKNTPPSDG